MKNVKFLLSAACALFAVAAMAQQDFSDPKYAVWGDTPQEREQNILNSNFLKESLDNKACKRIKQERAQLTLF